MSVRAVVHVCMHACGRVKRGRARSHGAVSHPCMQFRGAWRLGVCVLATSCLLAASPFCMQADSQAGISLLSHEVQGLRPTSSASSAGHVVERVQQRTFRVTCSSLGRRADLALPKFYVACRHDTACSDVFTCLCSDSSCVTCLCSSDGAFL